MDERSVTRAAPDPALAIVADGSFCAQAAGVLGCEEGPIREAFAGEPVAEVMEVVRWALRRREEDEGFDAAAVLAAWAQKRGRGAWSGRPLPEATPAGHDARAREGSARLAEALVGYWSERPEELAGLLDRIRESLDGKNGRA